MMLDLAVWPPYCGAEYPGLVLFGAVVVCSRMIHSPYEAHVNEETGFTWHGKR